MLVMMAGNGYTTIPVRFKTKERIANICPKSETWDEYINELLGRAEKRYVKNKSRRE